MNNNLTFNSLKEMAKNISIENENIEKLYIERLESQSMSSSVDFFNILFVTTNNSVSDDIIDIAENFGEISAMFQDENSSIESFKIIYESMVQGIFRFLNIEEIKKLNEIEDKYICVLNKNEENGVRIFNDNKINKLDEDEFLANTCNFFWNALKIGKKLYSNEFLNISVEYRNMIELIDLHLKHYVLSENKYVLDLGKEDKLVFNYVENEIFERYISCYSKLELENLWFALFNMCSLFRKLSLQIAINLKFEYAKELDRETINYLRELKQTTL